MCYAIGSLSYFLLDRFYLVDSKCSGMILTYRL